jgi:uncharacterized protein YigE (DUF2233 family)
MTIATESCSQKRRSGSRRIGTALFGWLGACLFVGLGQPAIAASNICDRQEFEGAAYIVCSFAPTGGGLRLFWHNADGQPYRSFSALAAAAEAKGDALRFALNAGMYREDFSPMGLYVEDGRELRPVNTGGGGAKPVPNFFKKPNGVFYLTKDGAGIDKFVKARPTVLFATQSGPLLVNRGKLHPSLIKGSEFTNRRSGVGICEGGTIRFAISEGSVNFYDFGRMFRDGLGCPNALFLDGGNGVGLYLPEMGRNDFSWHGGYGPMFGLVE